MRMKAKSAALTSSLCWGRTPGPTAPDPTPLHGVVGVQVDQRLGDQVGLVPGRREPHPPASIGVAGVNEDVPDSADGPGQQRDVAEDPGQPPGVLILQISARRVLVNPDGKDVGARTQGLRGVELHR
ncbi:hypothetical protein [Nonomuraea turkmeniaca]|uniref:hypothetical protein n=1 Tax=Nonomuraea turkmeniaca TaxID=103838 RepID=UPI0026B1C81F